ncbi:MAG: hypothetical protein E7352_00280 [Clostridiales bacterium]|nr:hypothetical protein [Clostridiales bacterium]
MKKIISLLLASFLSISLLSACGEKRGGKTSTNESSNSNVLDSEIIGSDASDSAENENEINAESYTVSLVYKGEKFMPTADMYVQWTGITDTGEITGFQRAGFNEDGIAYLNGLDGEYRITLGNLPDGYAYNPNVHVASGNYRNVVVEIYPIIPTKGTGADEYKNIINISSEGIYRVTLKKGYAQKMGIFYQFTAPRNGLYSIQSIVDVLQDKINPIAEIYSGNTEFKTFSHTCDGGVDFENGSFTKNFYFECDSTDEQSGHKVVPFAVRAVSKDGTYPITVDFLVTRKDDFEDDREEAELIYAKECPSTKAPEGVGTWVGAETEKNGSWSFDGSNYVYNEEDGFYHVGTKDGPYLYADIKTRCRFLPLYYPSPGQGYVSGLEWSFVTAEYTLPEAYLRVAELDRTTGERTGRLIHYKPMIEQQYALVCNDDGRCLVTEELKWFLQEICESKAYFNDGYGWVETYSLAEFGYSISALENDQWLFACGYYQ